jgi:hypothetical protein
MKTYLRLALVVLFLPVFAHAQDNTYNNWGFGGFVGQKAQAKQQSRWSLDDWLATRDKMKMEDLWLNLHSPTPYEFFVLAAGNLTTNTVNDQKFQMKYGVGAYAQIVGIEADHESLVCDAYNARFHLRIFGTNVQNTNITLHLGIRQRIEPQTFRQSYAGASMTLYFRKHFGTFLQYRYYLASTPNDSFGDVVGPRYEIGPFIDFSALRLFGNYVSESEFAKGGTYSASANGWMIGVQLFL